MPCMRANCSRMLSTFLGPNLFAMKRMCLVLDEAWHGTRCARNAQYARASLGVQPASFACLAPPLSELGDGPSNRRFAEHVLQVVDERRVAAVFYQFVPSEAKLVDRRKECIVHFRLFLPPV